MSTDFNIIHLRNTRSYDPDGSYVSTGRVFTAGTNGKQLWTNDLNLNNLSVSTLTLQSSLTVTNMVVQSTLTTSTLLTGTATFSQKSQFNTGVSIKGSPAGSWDVVTEYTDIDYQNLIFSDSTSPTKVITFRGNSGKIACSGLTASKILISDQYQTITASNTDSIKVIYLDNVSSDIQTQLNSKLNLSGGNLTGALDMGSNKITSTYSPVNGPDLTNKTFVDTADALKANLSGGNSFSGSQNYSDKTLNTVAIFDASKNLTSSAISTTELNYISGVTSAIQTQLNTKAPTSYVNDADALRVAKTGDTMTGTLYNSVGNFYLYRGSNTNRGIYLFANDADGNTYSTNNGGLGSWFGISFYCSFDGASRFVFDTRSGNSSQTGKLTVAGIDSSAGITGKEGIFNTGNTAASANFALTLRDSTTIPHKLWFAPNLDTGLYNANVLVGDFGIFTNYDDGPTGSSAIALGPWNGTNLVRITPTNTQFYGSVGIGLGIPRQSLDVVGNIVTDWIAGERVIGTQHQTGSEYFLGIKTDTTNRLTKITSLAGDNVGGVTINTGSSATERMRIQAGGNVGIGITNPTEKLHVFGRAIVADLKPYVFTDFTVVKSSAACSMVIASGGEALDATLYLGTPQNPLLSTGSAYKCAIIAKANGSATGWSTADLHFCVNGNTGSNDYTESAGITHSKMVIKSNTGNVGIGITNPTEKLTVNGNSLTFGSLRTYSNAVGGAGAIFAENGGTGDSYAVMFLRNNNTATGCYWFLNSTTRTGDGGANTATLRNDAGSLRLMSSAGSGILINGTTGNIGIGTTNPLCSLYNYAAGTTGWKAQSYFGNENTGVIAGCLDNKAIVGGHNAALNAWTDLYLAPAGNVIIGNDLSVAGNITTTGNVGIGTINSIEKLTVNGDISLGKFGNPGTGGTAFGDERSRYSIKLAGYRDVLSNRLGAKISVVNRVGSDGIYMNMSDLTFATTPNAVYEADDTVERMVIKADGNVGIGITNPTAKLHLQGTNKLMTFSNVTTSPNYLEINTNSGSGKMFMGMDNSAGTGLFGSGDAYGVCIGSATNTSFNIATNNTIRMKILTNGSAQLYGGDTSICLYGPNTTWSSYLRVGAGTDAVSTTTAQVISTNGNLHLDGASTRAIYYGLYANQAGSPNVHYIYGMTQVSGRFSVGAADVAQSRTLMTVSNGAMGSTFGNMDAWPDGANGCLYANAGPTNSSTAGLFVGYNNTNTTGYITSLGPNVAWLNLQIWAATSYVYYFGTLAAYTNSGGWVNVSDEREKEDIADLKTDKSLERILALKPKNYRRKFDGVNPVPDIIKEKRNVGFLAQEVQQTNPHCVSSWCKECAVCEDDDGMRLGLSYDDITVHLVGAVQEQQKQIGILQTQNQQLESKINELENIILKHNSLLSEIVGKLNNLV